MTTSSHASTTSSPRAEPVGAGPAAPALDSSLVSRALDGDEPAFRALYERHAPMVHAVLLSRESPGAAPADKP